MHNKSVIVKCFCESTTENNSSSDISSKVSQLGVLDPEHQLPPQPQVDQPTCTAAFVSNRDPALFRSAGCIEIITTSVV